MNGMDMTTGCQSARDRILRAAARLYALKGYDGTSVREIAEAAGVTKPLIYYHFASKENLYATLFRDAVEYAFARAQEIVQRGGTASSRLHDLLSTQVALAREYPEIYAFIHDAMTMPGLLPLGFDYREDGKRLGDVFSRVVEEGQRAGEFRDVAPEVVVAMSFGVLGLYVARVLAGDLPSIPEGMGDILFDLAVHGMEVRECC